MTTIETGIVAEIESERPKYPVGLLSRHQKDVLIERGIVGLYRWYVARSQATRNWNPHQSFDWRAMRTDHSPGLNQILEGFYAVEQYVPDYVRKLLNVVRKSYGRCQFQVRWGSEEQKHTEAWLNTLLFSRHRTAGWIRDYQQSLYNTEWPLPWEDPLHMLLYTLIQERATQLNYLNTAAIARGLSDRPEFRDDSDPVLDRVCRTIATDEAAHYNFFLEAARLYFYYYPARACEALVDVIKHFAMPAGDVIPDFKQFEEVMYRSGVFGPRQYVDDVLQVVIKNLGLRGNKALIAGLRRSRMVPDPHGNPRDTALFEAIDYAALQNAIQRLHGRISDFEQETGLADVDPTMFVASGLLPPVPDARGEFATEGIAAN